MHIRALVGASLAVVAFATPAVGNEDVLQQTAKPEQWVLQTGDYANQRYSKLNEINRDNVKNLKVAWTFSTGVLLAVIGIAALRGRQHNVRPHPSQHRLRSRSE